MNEKQFFQNCKTAKLFLMLLWDIYFANLVDLQANKCFHWWTNNLQWKINSNFINYGSLNLFGLFQRKTNQLFFQFVWIKGDFFSVWPENESFFKLFAFIHLGMSRPISKEVNESQNDPDLWVTQKKVFCVITLSCCIKRWLHERTATNSKLNTKWGNL